MTVTQAVALKIPLVFCPRCGWNLPQALTSWLEERCPGCREYGLDAIDPRAPA